MRLSVSRRGLTKLVESCFESCSEFFGGTSTPVMWKDDHGPVAGHVMMNRDNVEPFLRSTFKTEVTSLSSIATSP